MISITYVSSACAPFLSEELEALLIKARDNNARLGITGMLLYRGGNFMQTIEGESDAIHQLYRKVLADTSHQNVIKLLEHEINERSFSNWAMGFQDLDNIGDEHIQGYSDFFEASFTDISFQTNPSRAQKLLLMFRETMR